MNIGELLEALQTAASGLAGEDVRSIGAAKLVEEAISGLDCVKPPFFVHDSQLWYDTEGFGEIAFVKFTPQYGEDKRTCDGLSYQLQKVEVTLTRDLSSDMELAGLNRALQYAAAWERRQEARRNIERLEQQLAGEREVIQRMQGILGE